MQLQQVSAGQNAANTRTYRCDGLIFKASAERERVTLQLPERLLELPSVRAASGAKYSNGTLSFWSKGDSAVLELDGKTYRNCRASR